MILREDKTQSNIPCVVCGKLLTNGQVYDRNKKHGTNPIYTCSKSCGRLLSSNGIERAKIRHERYNNDCFCTNCGTKVKRPAAMLHWLKYGSYEDIYCSSLCYNIARRKSEDAFCIVCGKKLTPQVAKRRRSYGSEFTCSKLCTTKHKENKRKQIKQARTKGDNMAKQNIEILPLSDIITPSEGCNVIRNDNTRPEFDKIVAAFMALSNAEKALLIHSFMPWQKLETLEAHYEEAYPTVKPILHSVKAGDKLFHPSCIEVPVESVNDKYIGVTIDSMKIVVDKHGYKTSDEKRKSRILFLSLDDYIEYAKSRGSK